MPAAAVIPAPIAYIKIAAVKASVVEFRPIRLVVWVLLCLMRFPLWTWRVLGLPCSLPLL